MGKSKKDKKSKKSKGTDMGFFSGNKKDKKVKHKTTQRGYQHQTTVVADNKKKNKTKGKGFLSNFTRMALTKPTTGTDNNTLSVVLFKQSILDEISAICKPKAGGSEFQVHYRGIQYVIEKPGEMERVVITIPTVFFNMPQKVSSAAVDFNLDEIRAISNELIPVSEGVAMAFKDVFPAKEFEERGFKVTLRELEMGSLHRHPGNFGFSTTDLDNQVEKPGIIFRNRVCEDKVQIDSVMYIPGNTVQLVTTETRIVSVKEAEDGGIEGNYLKAPTISYIFQDAKDINKFGYFFKDDSIKSQKMEYKIDTDGIDDEYPIQDIFDAIILEGKYDPMIIVDADLIEQEFSYYSSKYNSRYGSYYQKGNSKRGNSYGNSFYNSGSYADDYSYLDDDYLDLAYEDDETQMPDTTSTVIVEDAPGSFSTSGTTKEERRELTRPKWQKSQTLSNLKLLGVDLEVYQPDLDGSTSEKDCIAVVRSLKDQKFEDVEIRSFLKECGYPADAMNKYYNQLAEQLSEK